jgi:hypothetical protein
MPLTKAGKAAISAAQKKRWAKQRRKIVRTIPIIHINQEIVSDKEEIDHPSHYGGNTIYEAIKVIEAWDLNFRVGNAVKYIRRANEKDTRVKNLQKAIWYLQREVDKLKHAPL